MTANSIKGFSGAGLALAMLFSTGCGEMVRDSRSPSQLVVVSMQAASGASPDEMGGTLLSDVVTLTTMWAR